MGIGRIGHRVTLRGVFFVPGPVLSGWVVYRIMFKVVDAFWICLIGESLFLQSFFVLKPLQIYWQKIEAEHQATQQHQALLSQGMCKMRGDSILGELFRNHLLDVPIFSFGQKHHLRPVQMWWMPRVERGVPLCPWPMQVGVSVSGASLIINRFSVGSEAPVWESPSWRDCRELRLYDLRGFINPSVVKVTRSSKKHAAVMLHLLLHVHFSVLILLLAILFSMVLRMGKKRIECAYVKSDITVNRASWICAFQTETPCLPWGNKHLKSFTNTILSSKKIPDHRRSHCSIPSVHLLSQPFAPGFALFCLKSPVGFPSHPSVEAA